MVMYVYINNETFLIYTHVGWSLWWFNACDDPVTSMEEQHLLQPCR